MQPLLLLRRRRRRQQQRRKKGGKTDEASARQRQERVCAERERERGGWLTVSAVVRSNVRVLVHRAAGSFLIWRGIGGVLGKGCRRVL